MKELNLRAKTMQISDKNVGGKSHDAGFENGLLNMTPKHWQ